MLLCVHNFAVGAPVGSFDAAVRTQLRWSEVREPALAAGASGVSSGGRLEFAAGTYTPPGCICVRLPVPVSLALGHHGSEPC